MQYIKGSTLLFFLCLTMVTTGTANTLHGEELSNSQQNPTQKTVSPTPVVPEKPASPPPGYTAAPPPGYSAAPEEATIEPFITADILGKKSHYFHPFFSLTGLFSDNIFFSPDNEIGDFITIISPGFWLSLPKTQQKLVDLDPNVDSAYPVIKVKTATVAPGGFVRNRDNQTTFNRYQAYFLYGADLERYSNHSEENITKHRAEGFFQYNLRSGLNFNIFDQFLHSYEPRSNNISRELDKFNSNLFGLTSEYILSDKFRARADYSLHNLSYSDGRNNDRDRQDNSFGGSFYFKFRPKTATFTEYKFVDIAYDSDNSKDSQEHQLYQGLEWQITGKSKGKIKLGYGWKDFNNASLGNDNMFLLQLEGTHTFSPKTSLHVTATRRYNETTVSGTNFTLSEELTATYTVKYREKAKFALYGFYGRDTYDGQLTFGNQTKDRNDDTFKIAPSIQYRFKKWLAADCAYIYTHRSSSFSAFDYDNNTIYLRLLFTL